MQKILTNISTVSAFVVLISSCTTSSGGPHQRDPVKTRKQGTQPTQITKPSAPTKAPAPQTPVEVEYCNFLERVSSPDKDFTEKDRQFFLGIASNPGPGTIHEAAMVIGILRDIVTPVGGNKSTFREVDVAAVKTPEKSTAVIETPSAKVEPSMTFESRCREKGVDCISALSGNPHLRTYAVYSMAFDASHIDGNSPLFTQNLLSTMKTETQSWGDLARKMGLDVQVVESNGNSVPPVQTAVQETPPVTATPDENVAANQILAKAVEYAGKEDFDRAITEARKVKQGTENYPAAQENLKSWANRAVQDLRRQAANQYRSSTSTSESAGKKAHLEKAKGFLENAITKYPEASTLDTVKENLDIIKKELDKLK